MEAHQAPPSLGFSRQEQWSGLPFPSPNAWKGNVNVKLLSRVRLLATPWTAAYQAPPSMGFSRQEYWSVGCNHLLWPTLLNSFKKLQRKEHFQIHSMRPPSPWYQIRQRQHKNRKLLANITDEYRCKNPQQNFNKQNSATHQKAHTPWSSWVYSRNVSILQYMQINQCDTPY